MNLDTIPSSDTTNWAQTNSYLGNQTVHHNAVTTLAIKHADHNNADIHVENTGDLSIAKVDVNDGTNFYITNTSGNGPTVNIRLFYRSLSKEWWGRGRCENRRLNIKI